jgi:UDP-N-acetylmuramate: L-alanyl-gamma-D-glutamyl-meso-diaminopimelate ligase
MHIHILGICGTFMGGLAAIAREAGHRVTGCDANVYPPMSTQLRALGIDLIEGYLPDQLALKPDLWVIGNVVSRGNPLMEALLNAGEHYVSGPQWLGAEVLTGRPILAVAGTHGKTTTTAMLAWILECAGLAPGFLIGGVPVDFPHSARLGAGRPFVIEADEYDTAFFDKRSKFLHYRPQTLILNNLEFDHADIFPDLGAIETQFHHLVRTVPGRGRLIVNAEEPALKRVIERGCWSECQWFQSPLGWHLRPVGPDRFDVFNGTQALGPLALPVAGAHNRANALAAIAASMHLGVDPSQALSALARFAGVRRRLELRGTPDSVSVFDDFAHHPSAFEATIAALREKVGAQARLVAVFEPRSNTMRMGTMRSRLAASLAGADAIYCHRDGLTWDPSVELSRLGDRAVCLPNGQALLDRLIEDLRPGDQVLIMSNGGFGGLHGRLLEALAARAGQPPAGALT